MTAFYKTNHPEVMAAVAKRNAELRSLYDAGAAFGKTFVGKPFYLKSDDYRFGGLIFEPRKDSNLWTSPGRHGEQRPRSQAKRGVTTAQREEHKLLRAAWSAEWPKDNVRADAVYKTIGTDWGAAFLVGVGFADRDGWLYVQTSAKLNERMTEILGSEYTAAIGGAK